MWTERTEFQAYFQARGVGRRERLPGRWGCEGLEGSGDFISGDLGGPKGSVTLSAFGTKEVRALLCLSQDEQNPISCYQTADVSVSLINIPKRMGTSIFWDRIGSLEKAWEWESDYIALFEPVGGALIMWNTWEFHLYESCLHIFLQHLRFPAVLFPPCEMPRFLPDFSPCTVLPDLLLWTTGSRVHCIMASSKSKPGFPFLLLVPTLIKLYFFPIFVLSFLLKKVFLSRFTFFIYSWLLMTLSHLILLSTHYAARNRKSNSNWNRKGLYWLRQLEDTSSSGLLVVGPGFRIY